MEFSQSFVVCHIVLKWHHRGVGAMSWDHSVLVPISLFGDSVDDILPDGSLTEAHKKIANENQKDRFEIHFHTPLLFWQPLKSCSA